MTTNLTSANSRPRYRRGTHWLAMLLTLILLLQVFVGAGLTSTNAVPTASSADSGGSPGGDAWVTVHQHGGRALAAVTLLMAILAWPAGGAARTLGAATFAFVAVQVVLGESRMHTACPYTPPTHGVVGQLCFALVCTVALVTSRSWVEVAAPAATKTAVSSRRLALALAGAVFVQLLLGAAQRHGAVGFALAAHMLWAMVVCIVVGWATLWFMAQHPDRKPLVRSAQVSAGLVVLQLLTGGFAFLTTSTVAFRSFGAAWVVPTIHAGVGAALLASSAVLLVATRRIVACEPDGPLEA